MCRIFDRGRAPVTCIVDSTSAAAAASPAAEAERDESTVDTPDAPSFERPGCLLAIGIGVDTFGSLDTDAAGEPSALPLTLPRPLPIAGPPCPIDALPPTENGAFSRPAGMSRPVVVAYALSFSPTHVRASHWPPAIPRTARSAGRQRRTGARAACPRSRGMVGAKPPTVLGGGWTRKGFVGRRYTGTGMLGSSVRGGTSWMSGGRARGTGSSSGVVQFERIMGEEVAVPTNAMNVSVQKCFYRIGKKTHIRSPRLRRRHGAA